MTQTDPQSPAPAGARPGKAAPGYLHGFSEREQARLREQARFAEFAVYRDVNLSHVKRLLEVGCGVGAQSEIILRRFPNLHLTGIDRSEAQLGAARAFLSSLQFAEGRFDLRSMDATNLEFPEGEFDGAFLCWILEHVQEPITVLNEVRRVLRPGAPVFITEVMNSSFFLDPYSPAVWKYWMAFNDLQYELKGDPFVGAKLGNLLVASGYRDIRTSVKTWHFDNRQPGRRREMIAYWTDLLLSAAEQLVSYGSVTPELVEDAKRELKTVSSNPNAVFLFDFMQAEATVF